MLTLDAISQLTGTALAIGFMVFAVKYLIAENRKSDLRITTIVDKYEDKIEQKDQRLEEMLKTTVAATTDNTAALRELSRLIRTRLPPNGTTDK